MEIYCLTSKNKYDWDIPNGKGEVSVLCPECSHTRKHNTDKCLRWNRDKDVGKCHHCLDVFVKVNKDFAPKKDFVKKDYKLPTTVGDILIDPVVEHFASARKISKKTLDIAKVTNSLRFNKEKKKETMWIRFDYYRDGQLVNSKYKTREKDFALETDAELIFYNLDSVSNSEIAIITEGEEDCLSFIEAGLHFSLSVPNGANKNLTYIDNSYDCISHIKTFYIATDEDVKGRMLRDELIRRFGSENCKIISFSHLTFTNKEGLVKECKDANDVLVHHGKEALLSCYNNAKEIPIKGVYDMGDGYNDLVDLWEKGMPKGNKIFHHKLNNIITWITPALAVWTGIPSHGKSEFVDEVCVQLNILHDWKVAYYSPENFPTKLHVSKIVSKITGKKFSKEEMSREELEQALSYVKDNFYFLYQEEELIDDNADDMTIDRILSQTKSLIKKHGIKQLVIDPVARISDYTDKNTDTKVIGKILNKIDRFAKSNDIIIHLVGHPTKMRKERDSGDYEVPTLYDISGSANFYNSAFYGFTIYRRGNSTEVYVNKVKFKHLGGKGMVKFGYHFDSGRYVELDEMDYADYNKVDSFLIPIYNAEDLTPPYSQPKPETNNDIPINKDFYEPKDYKEDDWSMFDKAEPPF